MHGNGAEPPGSRTTPPPRGSPQLVGFTAFSIEECAVENGEPMVYVYEIQVELAWRRHKELHLGTRMMQEVKRIARTAKVLGILLTVHENNPNQPFYRANGFAPELEWTPLEADYKIWVCML